MNWFRNGTAAIATMLMGVLAPMSGWQNRGPSDFQLSLIREYGRALFSQCRLEVVAYSGEGTASLTCSYAGVDGQGRSIPPLMARQELPPAETKRLADLVQGSTLYDGEQVGTHSEPTDGVLEMLTLRADGRAVVLVTSGNPSFTREGDRKELLSLLRTLERRLPDRTRTK